MKIQLEGLKQQHSSEFGAFQTMTLESPINSWAFGPRPHETQTVPLPLF